VVDQKIYLGLFAFLRDLEARRGASSRYFCGGEEIDSPPFAKGELEGDFENEKL